jgi:alpha-N-arabinofuranosidase
MTHANLEAVNTAKDMNAVAPRAGSGATVADGKFEAKLPPFSYQMFRLGVGKA